MSQHQASRTLLKSPPELWAELSDAESLARHLDDFGDIRITRLEPEQAVAWEGERVSGTVTLASSGWGTKVTLTARCAGQQVPEPIVRQTAAAPAAEPAEPARGEPVEPVPAEPPTAVRVGFIGRLRQLLVAEPAAAGPSPPLAEEPVSGPTSPAQPLAPRPGPTATPPETNGANGAGNLSEAEAALTAALDSLGKAHHRPFSRG